MSGLSNREVLAYGIADLKDGSKFTDDTSEIIFQHLLRQGKDWSYVDCDKDALLKAHSILENDLAENFSIAVSEFEAENETSYQIKKQRVNSIFNLMNKGCKMICNLKITILIFFILLT